jgi:hypothetical protein
MLKIPLKKLFDLYSSFTHLVLKKEEQVVQVAPPKIKPIKKFQHRKMKEIIDFARFKKIDESNIQRWLAGLSPKAVKEVSSSNGGHKQCALFNSSPNNISSVFSFIFYDSTRFQNNTQSV